MAKMLLINPMLPPSKRGRAKPAKKRGINPMAKRKRTAAQRAATRRLVAANKARRTTVGKTRKAPSRKRRANPLRAAGRASYGGRAMAVTRRRRNPVNSRVRVMDQVKQAAIAASGAIALDMAWSYLPVPASLNVGGVKHIAKGAGAILLGMLAGKIVSKRTADNMTLGALTVILHSAARDMITSAMPTIQMDGLGYYSAGQVVNGMGEYVTPGMIASPVNMGEYMSQNMSADQRAMAMDGMNYYS